MPGTTKWKAWLEEMGEDESSELAMEPLYDREHAVEDVAERYVEALESGGAFAGETMPDVHAVRVRTHDGVVYKVAVRTSYEISFYADAPELAS